MLTIRMQRTGRSGTAMFRVVAQDSRQTPTSGKVVALLGSYNPHTKALTLDKTKVAQYVEHGARPSPRVARLLQAEGVKLPVWVETNGGKQGKLRNPAKFRRDQPKEALADTAVPEEPAVAEPEALPEEPTKTTADTSAETPAE